MLRNIDSSNYAINFVAEAFHDLQNHFRQAYNFEYISIKEKYISDLVCYQAYADPRILYSDYIDGLLDVYNNSFLNINNITSFSDYVNNLIPFSKVLGSEFPITFSSWTRSKLASPFISGLFINVSQNQFDDDSLKEKDFIKSPNFDFYASACKSKGFYVSERHPNILIADINSRQMNKYMSKQSFLNGASVLNQVFSPTYNFDFNLLLSKLIDFYDKYINNVNPLRPEVKVARDNKVYIKVNNIKYNYNTNINNNILYNIYINIKNIEEDYIFSQSDINKFIQTAIKIEKRFDRNRSLSYIDNQYKRYYPSKHGGINYYNKLFESMED